VNLDVVVVTYNSAAFLPTALEALPDHARVIVVDNASADGSADVARSFGAEVTENPVNAGFAAAANRGASLGSAELVLFLNPDAHIDPKSLTALCDRLTADSGLGIISPRLRHPDGTEQRAWWPFPSAPRAWREALGLHRLTGSDETEVFVIGACFLVRRDVFDSLGGFDTRFWLYSEETDLCRRASAAGWRVELAGDLEADHLAGACGQGVEGLVFEHFERGGEHFVAKHGGPRELLSYRLANLKGAAIRSLLPGPAERRALHRSRAARLFRELRRHPTIVALDSPATRAPGQGLVVGSLEAWDDVWRRNQFFVRELLALDPNRRVLYVEPPYDWLHERRHPSGRSRRRGLTPLEGESRVIRFEPGKVLPRVLGGFADRSLHRQVRRAAHALGLDDPDLWVNDPHYAGLADATGWPAVYDITDDWAEAGDGGRATRRVRANEKRLFDECGAVVVCSEGLATTRRAARPDLTVIPNAVDVDHLTTPQPRPVDLPAGPTAVYLGTLHEDRLDIDLVADLAAAEPGVAVVLVGPNSLNEASNQRLATHANVHVLGARAYAQVPSYLQHADVVIVPHVVSPFTESLDPIKAYECLAVGRPTVTTPVAGFRDLGDPVRSVDRAGFVEAIRDQLAHPAPSAPQPVAGWGDRAAAFAAQLERTRRTRAQRELRVVFVDHCARLSGGELALARLLPALQELGVHAHVILGEHGALEAKLRQTGATVEVLALDARVGETRRDEVRLRMVGLQRAVATARDTWALRQRLRELQPDLVHTNSLKAALYGGVAGRLAGVPVVWHVRDRISPDYLPRPAVTLVHNLARFIPQAVIANSRTTRATLGSRLPVGVIPSPVVYDSVAQVHDRKAVPDRQFQAIIVGRLTHWKGQHVFLEAFAMAFAGGEERALIVGSAMFGEEAYEAELHELVTSLGLTDQVAFTGFVDDVGSMLALADCLVHASVLPEPFGQVVIEGMAAGLPVIASNEGGPAEVITDGIDGLLCPPGDPAALALLLRRLADDVDERVRLGVGGRNRAADFTPQVVAQQVRAVYLGAMRS
jgi:teichuronic acid biosynthesis glycosyltransferase TuaH